MSDADASASGLGNVDVVEAHGVVADDGQLVASRVKELGINGLGQQAEDPVAPGDLFQ